ncbi:MAG: terpene synthase family protein [Polyangiaceae bacterium]
MTADELAPFAAILTDPPTRELTEETLRWVRAHNVFEGTRLQGSARLVVVASVYAKLCSPPFATARQHRVAALFTLLFFYIDDAPAEELPSLLSGTEPWTVGRLTPCMRAFLDEFREMTTCTEELRESLSRSYHGYLRARAEELHNKARPLSVDEHWAFRQKTIFMDPYIDHWMILLQLDTTTFSVASFAAARTLATDIVLLSNDLGSVERDRPDGASPDDLNLVDAFVRERGWSRVEAIERLIERHNQMVQDVRAALRACADASGTESARSYAALLASIVDGNLGSLRALKFRYTGIAATLRRLEEVSWAHIQ